MRTANLTAWLVVLWSSTAVLGAGAAAAQSVPLPRPAPAKNVGTAAAANDPLGEVVRPPGAVPNAAPATIGAPAPATNSQLRTQTAPADAPNDGTQTAQPSGFPFDLRNITGSLHPGETTAFDAKQRALVDRISNYLTSVQTLVGDFVQVGPDGARTEGQFYIQKPGKVRFEYNPPAKIDIIADGQSVVVRDRELATQDVYPLSQTPLRFLLSDRIDLLKDTNLVSVSADDVFVTVVIEEKTAIVGTNRLMLMFGAKDFQLRQWTVTDPQGYDTTVAVYNLDTNTKPDPSMFKITYERTMQ
jgi:outer membrane lipoprotein-sorting protein